MACLPMITRSIALSAPAAFDRSMTALMAAATFTGSGFDEGDGASGVTIWTAESAPMASAVRRVSTLLAGPIDSAMIEVTAWVRSLSRMASSTATVKERLACESPNPVK